MKSEYLPGLYSGFAEAVEAQVNRRGSKAAITFVDSNDQPSVVTYAQLGATAKAIASGLQLHCKPGDRAFLIFEPGLELAQAFLACMYSGVIAVLSYPPANAKLGKKLHSLIHDCSPRVIVTSAMLAQAMGGDAVGKGPKVLRYDGLAQAPVHDWHPPIITPDSTAFLQYTSGSTSNPKGVMVSHANLLHNSTINSEFSGSYRDEAVVVNWLPPYHDMGLIGAILMPVAVGASAVLMSPMTFMRQPVKWLKAMSDYKGTASAGPNFAYDHCVDRIPEADKASLDLSAWSCAVSGAEPISAETLDRFYQAFKSTGFRRSAFVPCYGLAEATLCVTSATMGVGPVVQAVSKLGIQNGKVAAAANDTDQQVFVSSGRAHMDVQVVDTATSMPAPADCVGEIWVSGGSVATGYWNLPRESEETFGAVLATNGMRYLRTGDLGFMRDGELYVTGRSKDLIILNGQNFYPQDIERAAQQSHALLKSATTAAFEIRNKAASVCLVAEIAERDPADYAEVVRSVRKNVLKELGINIQRVVLIPVRELPKTTSGKIQRKQAQALLAKQALTVLLDDDQAGDVQLESAGSQVAAPRTAQSAASAAMRQTIKGALRRVMHLKAEDELDENVSFVELGMDSMMVVNLLCELEALPGGRPVAMADFQQNSTIAKLADFLVNDAGAAPVSVAPAPEPAPAPAPAAVPVHELARFTDFRQLPSYIELQSQRQQLRKLDIDRYFFQQVDGVATNSIDIDGAAYTNFSSFNYLGLSGHETVSDEAIAAIRRYGTSVSASRVVAGNKVLHAELEQEIAEFLGTEACVVFSAGHATNVGTITHLMGANDVIFYDSLCHNSLIQGAVFSQAARFAFNHDDPGHLEKLLARHRGKFERALILTEGVFSMDGDIPDIPALVTLKRRYGCWLMVDEAHSIGTIGATGRGICDHFDLAPHEIDILMGTLSKSLASCGGYIAGCNALVENLKYKSPGFVFSTGIAPANTAAALAAIRLIRQEPERVARVLHNAAFLLDGLKRLGANTGTSAGTPVVPIIMPTQEQTLQLSKALRKSHVLALPILYPAVPKDQTRVRFFVSSAHTTEDLQRAIDAVALSLPASSN
ncbi:aminotransferase class I/II-fold pyridoxal phosphate-dependent enzyme [Caenimonas koreensis]|uniref:aminotransferase class I/II-fold pyridoxal phosphate-dependent enzyme n=1 Tax=Caenimonas koreensis TaxID=367474 RepID=UPI003784FA18